MSYIGLDQHNNYIDEILSIFRINVATFNWSLKC